MPRSGWASILSMKGGRKRSFPVPTPPVINWFLCACQLPERCVTHRKNEAAKYYSGGAKGRVLADTTLRMAPPSALLFRAANRTLPISHFPPSPAQVQAVQEQQTEQVAQLSIDMPVVVLSTTAGPVPLPSNLVPHCVYIIYALACSISTQSPDPEPKMVIVMSSPSHRMSQQLLVGLRPLTPHEAGFQFDFPFTAWPWSWPIKFLVRYLYPAAFICNAKQIASQVSALFPLKLFRQLLMAMHFLQRQLFYIFLQFSRW